MLFFKRKTSGNHEYFRRCLLDMNLRFFAGLPPVLEDAFAFGMLQMFVG